MSFDSWFGLPVGITTFRRPKNFGNPSPCCVVCKSVGQQERTMLSLVACALEVRNLHTFVSCYEAHSACLQLMVSHCRNLRTAKVFSSSSYQESSQRSAFSSSGSGSATAFGRIPPQGAGAQPLAVEWGEPPQQTRVAQYAGTKSAGRFSQATILNASPLLCRGTRRSLRNASSAYVWPSSSQNSTS